MKRTIAVLLLLAMCFSLYACKEEPEDTTTDEDTTIEDNTDKNTGKDTDKNTDDTEENKTITLTKDNFYDYFAISYNILNPRKDNYG